MPLLSVEGGNNDFFAGPMAETRWLRQSPYLRQVLASFSVVFGRSRLMGLSGGAEVPAHCDINYHWFSRVRIHVPVITFPEVTFHCGDRSLHMAAGEAWIFDNWRPHRVVNPSAQLRVHLVAGLTRTELDATTTRLARRWSEEDAIATGVDSLAVRLVADAPPVPPA